METQLQNKDSNIISCIIQSNFSLPTPQKDNWDKYSVNKRTCTTLHTKRQSDTQTGSSERPGTAQWHFVRAEEEEEEFIYHK